VVLEFSPGFARLPMPTGSYAKIFPPRRNDHTSGSVGAPNEGARPPGVAGTGGASGERLGPSGRGEPGSESTPVLGAGGGAGAAGAAAAAGAAGATAGAAGGSSAAYATRAESEVANTSAASPERSKLRGRPALAESALTLLSSGSQLRQSASAELWRCTQSAGVDIGVRLLLARSFLGGSRGVGPAGARQGLSELTKVQASP
jgi:hypothetical protein